MIEEPLIKEVEDYLAGRFSSVRTYINGAGMDHFSFHFEGMVLTCSVSVTPFFWLGCSSLGIPATTHRGEFTVEDVRNAIDAMMESVKLQTAYENIKAFMIHLGFEESVVEQMVITDKWDMSTILLDLVANKTGMELGEVEQFFKEFTENNQPITK